MNMCQVRELLFHSFQTGITFEQVQELERQWGTPFYIFDSVRAQDNARELKKFLGSKIKLCYSVKANPWLVEELADVVDYLDICTKGELELCDKIGIRGEKLVYEGPCKKEEDVRKAVREGFHRISIDSYGQFELIRRIAREEGRTDVPVLLRLFAGTQFGMEIEEIVRLLECGYPELSVRGIHYYRGTQRQYPEQLKREFQKLMERLLRLEALSGFFPEELEFGAGLGVPYFQEDLEEDFINSLEIVRGFVEELSKRSQVTFEAGRCISASAGCFISRIQEEKILHGGRYLFLDAGTSQMEYYGSALGRRTPKYDVLCRKISDGYEEAVICGCLCAAGDIFVKAGKVPRMAKPGDYLVFHSTGAYAASESRAQFLCMDFPPLLMYNRNHKSFWAKRNRVSSYDLGKKTGENDKMTRHEKILEECKELICRLWKKERGYDYIEPILEESRLKEDLQLDSLMLVVLQVEVEDTFRFRFDNFSDDFEKIFATIGTLCNYIEGRIGENIYE